MYHLEIRKFPHNACRFNLSEAELAAIVIPWVREEWLEFGERKWNSNEAKITVLEGPELEFQELRMSRGWRNAERESTDVTERVLAFAKAHIDGQHAPEAAAHASPAQASAEERPHASAGEPQHARAEGSDAGSDLLADSLGLELLSLLADGPAPLSEAWRLAQARLPERPAGDALTLAEHAVSLLLGKRLIVLEPIDDSGRGLALDEQQLALALRALESWGSAGQPGSIRVRRA
jgi:hypothetical protein